ncbi:MAG: arginyl-tRNA synthetase [Pirellulaceae bacterium]|jgi:arginyl-tRNA synthetase
MSILSTLKERFQPVLASMIDDSDGLLEMIKPAKSLEHGDYQANCAMSMKGKLGGNPRDIAAKIVEGLQIDDICEPPEVAGPGFINLKLKDSWIKEQFQSASKDERLGVPTAGVPKTFVIDYSSPNVAKPMHVGHIRSTVIGDALARTLRFAGHKVITDNHLGDWGTQFGMIIYGYKNFVDQQQFEVAPVPELSRIYRLVAQLTGYFEAQVKLEKLQAEHLKVANALEELKNSEPEAKAEKKKHEKAKSAAEKKVKDLLDSIGSNKAQIEAVDDSPELTKLVGEHPKICTAVLQETVKLHEGDEENLALWHQFLPHCRDEIQKVYRRLDIKFDYEHGESYYHDQLAAVVQDFVSKGLARESAGAMCVFLPDFEAPMIIQKQDGAFLYSTTDLATIKYRLETWNPDEILYVVDFRQSEHFDKLIAAANLWGYGNVELNHVKFGTVMGNDGKPFKTRSGDTVGLEGLLDDAVAAAYKVVCENDEEKQQFSDETRRHISNVVGHAAIKYADLSLNRESDYVFDLEQMVATQGNTATYMQYSFARVQSIFAKGEIDIDALRQENVVVVVDSLEERALVLELLKFGDAINDVLVDYRPHMLSSYLFSLSQKYAKFFQSCPVLKSEGDLQKSRLALCDLTAKVIRKGLELLGISVIDRM